MSINSDINIIGSIPDFSLIETAFTLSAQNKGKSDLKELLVNSNSFDFRTEGTRKRFLTTVSRCFLTYKNNTQQQLIQSLYTAPGLIELKRRVIFWQLLCCNSLFFLISKNVYIKAYFAGRATIDLGEIFAYLKEMQSETDDLNSFSDSTLDRISSKYLTTLKKLGMVEGKAKKNILNVRLSEDEILFFAFFCSSIDETNADLLKNPFSDFFFMERQQLIAAFKNIKYTPFVNITTTGDNLMVYPKVTPEELVNALHN